MLHGMELVGRPCFVGVHYVLKIPQRGILSPITISVEHETKALVTKVFLEIRIFEYFGYLRLGSNEFLAMIPNQPALRRVKCNPEKLYAKNCFFGGHVTSAWLDGRQGFVSRSS